MPFFGQKWCFCASGECVQFPIWSIRPMAFCFNDAAGMVGPIGGATFQGRLERPNWKWHGVHYLRMVELIWTDDSHEVICDFMMYIVVIKPMLHKVITNSIVIACNCCSYVNGMIQRLVHPTRHRLVRFLRRGDLQLWRCGQGTLILYCVTYLLCSFEYTRLLFVFLLVSKTYMWFMWLLFVVL